MPSLGFDELEVYKLPERLADAVWETVDTWDRLARRTVGEQVVRSADSVGANIAEGAGRGTFKDNRRFVHYARGSLYETRHGLRRAQKRGLLTRDQSARLRPILDELGPRLNAYLRSIGRTTPPRPIAERRGSNAPRTNDK
ncbi:four helix bundle protein [Rubrivirga sp. S365]|uniref:four helix bundle protein n=1 Tax=Rubrivirga sp. S365 TaxID=3076080 RepID=UPI0028CA6FDE|nr:four helix bundle protein [Rubrivirga sp. S365]MDT7856764.1 four helix bundle protein [Rubrivirga sp. S365]